MITQPRVWDLLSKWITPEDAEIERSAVYTFHSVITEHWRGGRLLLAGDSAHQTPPFLGQGMCAGIRDAANLAWKLARVVQGKDSDTLLDSYQSEREPHVWEYIELAIRLGGIINTTAIEAGLPVGERKPDGTARMESTKPLLGVGLCAGRTETTGQLAPQPELTDGTRLDAHTGRRFALLATPAFSAALLKGTRRRIADADIALVDDTAPALQDWLTNKGEGGAGPAGPLCAGQRLRSGRPQGSVGSACSDSMPGSLIALRATPPV